MIRRKHYTGNNGYSHVINVMKEKLGDEITENIIDEAAAYGNKLCQEYDDLSGKEKIHIQDMIIPRAAFYLQMRKYLSQEESVSLMEEAVRIGVEKDVTALEKWTRLSLVRSLFMKVGPKLITSLFGENAGFRTEMICADKRRIRFDVLDCPYHRTCTKLGCPELTKTFCLSDDYIYGAMNGIEFIRHGSIGRGFEKCDFDYVRKQ